MTPNIIYQEERASVAITLILGLVTLVIVGFFVAQLILGPLVSKPVDNWVLCLFSLLFLLLTICFRKIKIILSNQGVSVSYLFFGKTLKWENISNCEEDRENTWFGGWGIRLGRYKRNWIWVYNVIGGPRVVFETVNNKPWGLIVSTSNPSQIVQVSQKYLRR